MNSPIRVGFLMSLAAALAFGLVARPVVAGEVEEALDVDLFTGAETLDEGAPGVVTDGATVVTADEPLVADIPGGEDLDVVVETIETSLPGFDDGGADAEEPVTAEETPVAEWTEEEPAFEAEPAGDVMEETEPVPAEEPMAEEVPGVVEAAVAEAEMPEGNESMPAAEVMVAEGTSREIGLLLNALHRKDQDLAAARSEIARLRGLLSQAEKQDRRDEVAVLYNLGCVYRAGGYYEKAEKAFLRALDLNDADAALHYNLAILYDDDLGRKDKARAHYERFLELAPNDKDAPRVVEWLRSIMP